VNILAARSARLRAVNQRTLSWAVAGLALAGAAREVWFHAVSEPIGQLPSAVRERRPEAGYAQVRRLLPRTGRVGYLTDVPVSTTPGHREGAELGTWLYLQTAYALAPLVLVHGDAGTDPVLACVVHAERLEELARVHGLRVEARFEGGRVALLRR
jgi:hypothetical protein